ncbi:hypothetical protein POTOM_032648 [Populus tomentosa]|uniref:MBD domain-containing protein n=1 Tax=Populus tomentosa TaxID=118781 RepID=A0A8X7Z449_POPTO|nr:hypothetical protein POTOM_032648 [Populus tomentosa]
MSDTATPAQFPGTDRPVPNQDDVLLQNGSVIDPNTRTTAVETLTRPNNKGNQQPVTPVRAKRRSSEMTIVTSWLPPGWVVEDRIRTSGVTAGTVDKEKGGRAQLMTWLHGLLPQSSNAVSNSLCSGSGMLTNSHIHYYIDPASGRKFRSKKDVQYYLETGTLKKKGKLTENSDADTNSAGNLKGDKNKSAANTSFALNFDSFNVPERTEWVLANANEDTWIPFIDGKKVPLYDKEQWDFAFASLTTSSHGKRKR